MARPKKQEIRWRVTLTDSESWNEVGGISTIFVDRETAEFVARACNAAKDEIWNLIPREDAYGPVHEMIDKVYFDLHYAPIEENRVRPPRKARAK